MRRIAPRIAVQPGLLQRVREACREVAERARFVRIDRERLLALAASLAGAEPRGPDPAIHHLGRGAETVAFVLVLDAVNFGSGYFPYLRRRPGLGGYETIAAGLTDLFRTYGPPTAEDLGRLTPADCAKIFGQDLEHPMTGPLMRYFAASLNDLGRYVRDRFGGDFTALVEAAGGSCERLVALLLGMPMYRDVRRYGDLEVPFYKRAQITCADLYWAFGGKEWGWFRDIDALTIFADNAVPHVLRMEGVLRYDPELATRIDRGEPLPAGSPEEVEIRSCAVHAAELLVGELVRRGLLMNAMRLDALLWERAQQPLYRSRPPHRTLTTDY